MVKRSSQRAALTEEVGSLVFRARRRVLEACSRRMGADGESVLVLQVLWHLDLRGDLTQRGLAELTGQHPAGVSRTLEDLEARGLVHRERGADRRCLHAALTKKGRVLATRLKGKFRAATEESLADLSDDELRTLERLLLRVTEPRA